MAQRKKEEEERRVREVEEKKQREIEEKRQRLEEAEKKRQAMLQAMKDKDKKGPNFTIQKKEGALGLTSTQIERNKTKEQLEEEKKISLSFRIKPLDIDNMGESKLRDKAQELWEAIVKLETEKYDLEERQKRQDYDLKELKERQKQQLRHKALKKGLDPEALTGKYPVSILYYQLKTNRNQTIIKIVFLKLAKDPSCFQIWTTRGHPLIRRQEETLRRCKYFIKIHYKFNYYFKNQ